MDKHEIQAIINANPAFFLATTEDGQPRVRGMLLYRADDNGVVFHTGGMKDVYRQLMANPAVELCFFDQQQMVQVRVRGTARLIDDLQLKQEIVNAPGREFLKPWVESQGIDILEVFRVEDCQALVWSMATNFAPKELVRISG
ncbi:MAG: pyridoxamine 5'-phosphate oxidase family protein [Pelobacteraceae bacterium]